MFTIVASRTTMSWAMPMTHRTSHRRRSPPASPGTAAGWPAVLAAFMIPTYLEVTSPLFRHYTLNRRGHLHYPAARTETTGKERMPNASDRPLRRDAALNRRRILHAAAEVFTARGLGASLDDVARQAGVGVGTVYRRFPDKDTLIEALFEERLGAITGVAERALAEPDSWTALVTFLENASSLMAADRGLREILMYASHGRDR